MIEIKIEFTDHTWPWRWELSSDTIDVTNDGTIPWWQYAPSAETAFKNAMAAKDEINFRFWQANQTELF